MLRVQSHLSPLGSYSSLLSAFPSGTVLACTSIMKLDISKLTCRIFDIPFKVQGHRVPHWKSLKFVKYDPRGLRCTSTFESVRAS